MPYEITVPEDAAVGATVFSGIKVSDADSVGTNIEVQCENVIDYLEGCDTFSIDTNNSTANHYEGSLVLKHKLNYNQQRQYQFILRAMVRLCLQKLRESYSCCCFRMASLIAQL